MSTPASFSWKSRVVGAILVVTTLWPLAHFGVVRALDLNPWKWFGWAMYTTTPTRVRAAPWSTDGRPLDLTDVPRAAAQAAQQAYGDYSRMHMEIGAYARPDDFARALFRAYPDVEAMEIQVTEVTVDRETAMLVERPAPGSPHAYRRKDVGE